MDSQRIHHGSAGNSHPVAGTAGSLELPPPSANSVPPWVFAVNLPDRLVRCLVAAHRFAHGGRWRADVSSAKALAITDRTLRAWTSALARAGFMRKVGRATYELRSAA